MRTDASANRLEPPRFHAGDVLAVSAPIRPGRWDWLAWLIQLCSWGPYKHVAILACPDEGPLAVWESTATSTHPCMIRGEVFAGVQAHPLDSWLQWAADRGEVVDHFELVKPLTFEQSRALTRYLHVILLGPKGKGTPYDYRGAAWSRSGCCGWAAHLASLYWGWGKECLAKLFCSELVGSALRKIQAWMTANASAWNPSQLVRMLLYRDGVVKEPRCVVRDGEVTG